jgi:hypothetical protein
MRGNSLFTPQICLLFETFQGDDQRVFSNKKTLSQSIRPPRPVVISIIKARNGEVMNQDERESGKCEILLRWE